jgi:photosystem II stability/assembly factor-like uncharacterized protein
MTRILFPALLLSLMLHAPATLRAQDFWVPANEGLYGATVTAFHLDDDRRIYAVTKVGIYRSDDRGGRWRQLRLALGTDILSTLVTPDGTVYVTTQDSIHASRDRGESWSAVRRAPGGVQSFLGADSAGFIYGSVSGAIARSSDGGSSWAAIIPRSRIHGHRFNTMSLDVAGLMLLGTDSSLLVSTDRGGTWDSVTGPGRFGELREYFAADVVSGGALLVATSRGLFRSIDTAATWTRVDTLPVTRIHSGSDGNVYQIFDALPGCVTIPPRPAGVRVSADGGLSWRTLRDERVTSIYPTPASGPATIGFTTSAAGMVTVELHTVAGERVSRLFRGRRAAGLQEVYFDVSDLADGVYIYRITDGGKTMYGRMTVMR